MITVTCQDCGREVELNDFYVDGMVATGEIVKGKKRVQKPVRDANSGELDEMDHYLDCVYDVCKACANLKTVRGPGYDEEREREKRIQRKIRLLKEMRPDLSLEERAHAAVEEEFNPKYEPNTAFRDYLTERYGL